MARDVPPDDLPRSPTGRVPQWVRDEAAGRQVDGAAWRADGPDPLAGVASVTTLSSRRRTRRRAVGRSGTITLVVVCAALAGVFVLLQRSGGAVPGVAGATTPVPGGAYGRPPVGQEEGERPRSSLDAPIPATKAAGWSYIATQKDGRTPVTWSPCRPIHYVVRTANETTDGLGLLRSALDEVSRDTGLAFVYDGTTTEDPSPQREPYQPGRYGDRWAPVLVAWVTPQEDPDSAPPVLGLTRPQSMSPGPGAPYAYVTGQVEMSTAEIAAIQKEDGVVATRTVFLHELGHLVGLEHVEDPKALMDPTYATGVSTFLPAELEGLRSLGSGTCRGDI